MSKYDMCEALYALPDGVVVKRRKSVAVPLLLLVAGAAMLVANGFVGGSADNADLKSALVLFGVIMVLSGGITAAVRLFGDGGAPYHSGDGCFLRREELKFDKERAAEVADAIRRGDFEALRAIPQGGVSAVTAVLYSSAASGFAACRAFEYVELEMRPVCEMKVVRGRTCAEG